MNLLILQMLICLLTAGQAFAVNDSFVTMWNGFKTHGFCYDARGDRIDVPTAADCPSGQSNNGKPNKTERPLAKRMFQQFVLEESSALQIQKNQCLIEKLEFLKNPKNQQLMDRWSQIVLQNWMGQKKMHIISQTCAHIPYEIFTGDFGGVSKERFLQMRVPKDWHEKMQDTKFLAQWKPVCMDQKLMQKIDSADDFFPSGVPVLTSQEMLSMMGNHRANIINQATQKPISDQDLFGTDLRKDAKRFQLYNAGQFQDKVAKRFSEIIEEKKNINKKLQNFLGGSTAQKRDMRFMMKGESDLDEGLQDYMFEEGTIFEVLSSNQMIQSPENNLSAAAGCMIAKLEPSFSGEVAEFVGSGLGVSGAFFKIIKGATKLRKLKSYQKIGKASLQKGFLAAGAPAVLGHLKHDCFDSGRSDSRVKERALIETSEAPDAVLPQTGFKIRPLDIPEDETPTCKSLRVKDQAVTAGESCIQNTLFNVLPMQISLPLIMGH